MKLLNMMSCKMRIEFMASQQIYEEVDVRHLNWMLSMSQLTVFILDLASLDNFDLSFSLSLFIIKPSSTRIQYAVCYHPTLLTQRPQILKVLVAKQPSLLVLLAPALASVPPPPTTDGGFDLWYLGGVLIGASDMNHGGPNPIGISTDNIPAG